MKWCEKNVLILGLCAMLCVPSGCSAFQNLNKTGQGVVVGGVAGGAVGAGVGAIIGGGKGTWIGALLGTAIGSGAGALVGSQMDKQRRELEQEMAQLEQQQSDLRDMIQIERAKDSNNLDAIKVVMGGGVLFRSGSSSLNPEANAALSRIAYNLKQNPNTYLTIVGYTDNTGTLERNMVLSKERAESVYLYLRSAGIAADRMQVVGEGWANPIASNDTAEGREQNRRVELYISPNKQMIEGAN